MIRIQVLGRVLLCAAFVAGSWEDILHGIASEADRAPWTSALPSSDAGDNEGEVPPEPVLISEPDLAMLIPVQSQLIQNPTQDAPAAPVVRRIPHVPKPLAHL